VNDRVVGAIEKGLCLLVGFGVNDTSAELPRMVSKILRLRLFPEPESTEADAGRWKCSLNDRADLSILAVSQFTLYARTDKGAKPDFHEAKPGAEARLLFDELVAQLRMKLSPDRVATGAFGEYMQVELVNDGPVTLLLE
jgi:D-tyrosyl-tRNA(Tyr) deacylase